MKLTGKSRSVNVFGRSCLTSETGTAPAAFVSRVVVFGSYPQFAEYVLVEEAHA
jgi:hypothetical protein